MDTPFTDLAGAGSVVRMESERQPVPGADYPRTFQEMDNWSRDDVGCREYIYRLRISI
jgi:hypothetical protein